MRLLLSRIALIQHAFSPTPDFADHRIIRSDMITSSRVNVPPISTDSDSLLQERGQGKKEERLLIYGGNNSGVRATGEADICLDPISKFSTRAISVAAAVMSTQVLYMRTRWTEKRASGGNAGLLLTQKRWLSRRCVLIKRNLVE